MNIVMWRNYDNPLLSDSWRRMGKGITSICLGFWDLQVLPEDVVISLSEGKPRRWFGASRYTVFYERLFWGWEAFEKHPSFWVVIADTDIIPLHPYAVANLKEFLLSVEGKADIVGQCPIAPGEGMYFWHYTQEFEFHVGGVRIQPPGTVSVAFLAVKGEIFPDFCRFLFDYLMSIPLTLEDPPMHIFVQRERPRYMVFPPTIIRFLYYLDDLRGVDFDNLNAHFVHVTHAHVGELDLWGWIKDLFKNHYHYIQKF